MVVCICLEDSAAAALRAAVSSTVASSHVVYHLYVFVPRILLKPCMRQWTEAVSGSVTGSNVLYVRCREDV